MANFHALRRFVYVHKRSIRAVLWASIGYLAAHWLPLWPRSSEQNSLLPCPVPLVSGFGDATDEAPSAGSADSRLQARVRELEAQLRAAEEYQGRWAQSVRALNSSAQEIHFLNVALASAEDRVTRCKTKLTAKEADCRSKLEESDVFQPATASIVNVFGRHVVPTSTAEVFSSESSTSKGTPNKSEGVWSPAHGKLHPTPVDVEQPDIADPQLNEGQHLEPTTSCIVATALRAPRHTLSDKVILKRMKAMGSNGSFAQYIVNLGAGCYSDSVRECLERDAGLREMLASGWSSLLVDARIASSKVLEKIAEPLEARSIRVVGESVTPLNVRAMFVNYTVPKNPFLLKIDIDGYDCPVLEAVIAADYRPACVFMEVNPDIPPPIEFSVLYSADHVVNSGEAGYFSCSVSYASKIMRPAGYRLLQYDMRYSSHDLIWVHESSAHLFSMELDSDWDAFVNGWADSLGKPAAEMLDRGLTPCMRFKIEDDFQVSCTLMLAASAVEVTSDAPSFSSLEALLTQLRPELRRRGELHNKGATGAGFALGLSPASSRTWRCKPGR